MVCEPDTYKKIPKKYSIRPLSTDGCNSYIFLGNEDVFLSVVDGRFEKYTIPVFEKVRIFFRLVIENPRSPGNSCCIVAI